MKKTDYNQFIMMDCLDNEAYESKFRFVDNVRATTKPHPKYIKQIWDDPTMFAYYFLKNNDGKPLKLYMYQDAILNDNHRYIYFRAANQLGKAEYEMNIIPTKDGFKYMKNIKIGDYVFDRFGIPTKVIGIPFEGPRPCYKLTFDDGSDIIVAKEHEWLCKPYKNRFRKTYTHNRGKKKGQKYKNIDYNKWTTLSTEEIIQVGKYDPTTIPRLKVSIPVTEPVLFGKKEYFVDPYIMGLLLGDGCMTTKKVNLVTGDIEIAEIFSLYTKGNILNRGKNYIINVPLDFVMKNLKKEIKIGCNSLTKYIPQKYLEGSKDQRLQLLKGLMDTDGSVYGKTSTLEYCTISERLCNDFIELINSLGGIVNKKTKKQTWYYDNNREKVYCNPAFVVRFRIDLNPFGLKRKSKKFKRVKVHKKERLIERIEFVGDLNTKCISVESEDHTYLSGFNYIVTHNSYLFNVKAVWNLLRDHGHSHNEAIVSKSLPQANYQMRRVKALLNSMRGIDWKENKGSADSMSVVSYDVKDNDGNVKYTNMLVCAPCTEGLLGYDLHDLNLDEFEYWVDIDLEWFFTQIAQPRTYATKGNIMIMSNPNGQDCYGAVLETQTLKDGITRKFHTYIFNYLDRPDNTQEEYDQLNHELSRQQFESTVAAVRSISSRNYFSPDEIAASFDPKLSELDMVGKQPYFFLDVGAKHDQSVLVGGYVEPDLEKKDMEGNPIIHVYIPIIHAYPVGYPLSRVVGANADDFDGWHHEKSVKEYLQEWSKDAIIPVLGVDVTGNSGISPLFNQAGIYPEDVVFNGPQKSGMYQRYKYFMEKKLLHRVKNKAWEYQAAHLEVRKSVRGYLMIHHENENDLDDTQDATAGLIFLADDPVNVPCSLKLF